MEFYYTPISYSYSFFVFDVLLNDIHFDLPVLSPDFPPNANGVQLRFAGVAPGLPLSSTLDAAVWPRELFGATFLGRIAGPLTHAGG